ncbi:metallophosphoesterase [Myxococcaceae bacterium GXIMD 01537]
MGRLLLVLLFNGGAFLVLRALWPELLRGRWRPVFATGALLTVLDWALPVLLGVGRHGTIPVIGVPLKFFSVMWLVTGAVLVLAGPPLLLLRRLMDRSARARAQRQGGESPAPVNHARRDLLMNVGRAVPLLAAGTSSAGVLGGATGFTVKQVELKLRGLPPALDGFRIGQITDVHVGPFIDTEYLREAVEAMNAAKVDLQVMTGDLIDDLEQLDGTMEALAACRAPHGMMAILGNHEHWRGVEPILAGYEDLERRGLPVRLLVDSAHVLEHAGQRVRVVGVDYPMRGSPGGSAGRMRRSAETAFQDMDLEREWVLCLTHHPDFFPHAAERGAKLTLAGHTHGGQVAFLGWSLFSFAFDYMLGRYRRGDSQLYVSGGTGHWMPFRLGVPPEVTVLTLRPA